MTLVRSNAPERELEELALRNGWEVTKRGWPDFVCFSPVDGEMIAVEVKPRFANGSRMKILKREQARVMDVLTAHGIRCFVSDGKTLEKYNRAKHAPRARRRKPKMLEAGSSI